MVFRTFFVKIKMLIYVGFASLSIPTPWHLLRIQFFFRKIHKKPFRAQRKHSWIVKLGTRFRRLHVNVKMLHLPRSNIQTLEKNTNVPVPLVFDEAAPRQNTKRTGAPHRGASVLLFLTAAVYPSHCRLHWPEYCRAARWKHCLHQRNVPMPIFPTRCGCPHTTKTADRRHQQYR